MNGLIEKLKANKGKATAALMTALVVLVGYLSPATRQKVMDAFGAAAVSAETAPVDSSAAPVDSSD